MDYNIVGEFLLLQRKTLKLTQKEVAELCNVSAQAVSNWERGETLPDISALESLSRVYNVSINTIISGGKTGNPELNQDMKLSIVGLVLSFIAIFVFFLIFAPLTLSFYFGVQLDVVLSGFDVLFKGYAGLIVVLVWLQFISVIILFLLYAFVTSGLIKYHFSTNVFIRYIAAILILLSIFSSLIGLSIVPQIILSVYATSMIILTLQHKNISSEVSKTGQYRTAVMILITYLFGVLLMGLSFHMDYDSGEVYTGIDFLSNVSMNGYNYSSYTSMARTIFMFLSIGVFFNLLFVTTLLKNKYLFRIGNLLLSLVMIFVVIEANTWYEGFFVVFLSYLLIFTFTMIVNLLNWRTVKK